MAQDVTQMADEDGEWGPLSRLEALIDEAKTLRIDEVADPPGDDPIRGLEALIQKARRDAQGEGARALQRLEDRIERARWLPEQDPYQSPERPLEALKARARGEEPNATNGREDEPPALQAAPISAGSSETTGRHAQLGEALEASLRQRPLPGPVRAEIAVRLAQILGDNDDDRLQALWELVVFGR